MKTIRQTTKPNGVVRMTIELEPGESLRTCRQDEHLIIIKDNAYYKLGEPMSDEVFAGHILADAAPVYWCTLSQKWIS